MRALTVVILAAIIAFFGAANSFSLGPRVSSPGPSGTKPATAAYVRDLVARRSKRLAPGTRLTGDVSVDLQAEPGTAGPGFPPYYRWLSSAGQSVFVRRARKAAPDASGRQYEQSERRSTSVNKTSLNTNRPAGFPSTPTPPNTITSLDQIVNNPDFDSVDFHTQSETSICANGNNLVESFNDTSGFIDPATSSIDGYSFSTDGGNTWTHQRIPQTNTQQTDGDGVVALGPNGEVYYGSLLATGPTVSTSAVGVAKSTDGGQTFTTMVNATTTDSSESAFNDKEWIRADRSSTSPFSGNVYVSWTHFGSPDSIDFSRSTNGGRTFSKPIPLSNGGNLDIPQGSNIGISPDGTINVVYFQLDESTGAANIFYVKSTNGGKKFTAPAAIATFISDTVIGEMTGIGNVRSNNFPMIAVGPDGSIHVVYGAQPLLLGPDRSDVFYLHSTDGGSTFSAPIRINDDNSATTQMFPSIAITSSGTVGIRWWDRRNDPIFDSLTDVYMVISQDLGNTFGPNFRVSKESSIYTPIESGLAAGYHGDYDSLTADGDTFYVPWSAEWRGNPDAYFAKVPSNFSPTGADFVVASQKLFIPVAPSSAVDVPVGISTLNGFSSNLSFSSLTQTPGVTLTFDQPSGGTSPTVDVHIQTDSTAVPGSYLYGITATGGGITHGTAFWVNVVAPGTGTPPVNISSTPGFSILSSQQQIDSNGVVHVVFYDDSQDVDFGDEIYYSRSSDGGVTFSPKLQLSTSGQSATAPVIGVDSAGNLYVGWTSTTFQTIDGAATSGVPSIQMTRSSDGGATFSKPQTLSLPTAVSEFVSFNVANDGTLTATYIDGNLNFFAVTSSDGGQTFSQPAAINQLGREGVLAASVFSDNKGSIAVAYLGFLIEGEQEVETVSANISRDYGQTFPLPSRLTSSPSAVPIATIGPDGSGYVLYSTAKFMLLSVAPNGQNFGAGSAITNEFFSPESVVVDNNNIVYIGYLNILFDSLTGNLSLPITVTRSADKGQSFSIPTALTSSQTIAEEISLIPDNKGNVNIAWSDLDTGANPVIFLAQSNDGGVTYSAPNNISNDPGDAQLPFLTTLPDGSLSLMWVDDSYENDEVVSTVLPAPVGSAPAFSLISQIDTISRATNTNLVVSISRKGQFSGAVTVTAPTGLAAGVTITPAQVTTTTTNATFVVKAKKANTYDLNFTGMDAAGASSTATITLQAQ